MRPTIALAFAALFSAHALKLPVWKDGCSRRSALFHHSYALAAAVLPSRAAFADYGEAAKQLPPALLPSPFKPTGAMAETCEVVALGREDICIEPKKLLSAYDILQLQRARESLEEAASYTPAELKPVLQEAVKLTELLEKSNWAALIKEQPRFDEMCKAQDSVSLSATAKAFGNSLAKKDGPVATKALVKLARELS